MTLNLILSFLCYVTNGEMINCRHIRLKVFAKYFALQDLYVKLPLKHHKQSSSFTFGCRLDTSGLKHVIYRSYYLLPEC